MIGPLGWYKARKLADNIVLAHDILQALYEEGEISSRSFTRVLGRVKMQQAKRALPLLGEADIRREMP